MDQNLSEHTTMLVDDKKIETDQILWGEDGVRPPPPNPP
jgi:hypothetical protein